MPTFRPGFAHPLEDLRDEFDRLWNTLTAAPPLHGWGTRHAGPAFPAVNVAESEDAVTVEAELPGLAAGDVEISVADDELVLTGSRPEVVAAEAGTAGDGERKPAVTWHRRERGSGRFERRIPLPVAVDAGRVEARLVDGVLTVTCPKAPEAKPRKVEVRSA
jgi:HSP20 family protein